MSIPILATKLHIPASPAALVPRPRLTARLDAALAGRLVLVSAPAGWGKTSLLAEWARGCGDSCRVCWLHLDESDREPVRFLSYLIAAVRTQQQEFGEAALSGLQAVPPAPVQAVLTSLINEFDQLADRLVLVLDDYHLVDDAAIHEAVGFLIEHLPAQVCLVIATRTDPPLPLHRLRARGQLAEIRLRELRFDRDETRSLLEGMLGRPFAAADLAALDNRVEGWAAGLQMAALSMQGREDIAGFVASFSASHRYIMDYLSEEIFAGRPPAVQTFLLKTSILERLCEPLCEAVLAEEAPVQQAGEGPATAGQMLAYLERLNLFLLPLDDERRWYRYHRLFAGLLRQRLRQVLPQQVAALQRRASAWFADQGLLEEAFQYALAAEDPPAAAQIVAAHGMALLKQGSLATILGWIDRLPEAVFAGRPRLNVIAAWALLLGGRTVDVESYLQAAEASRDDPAFDQALAGEIAAIRAYTAARQQDLDSALEQARRALELLPGDDFSIRSVVSFVLGGAHFLRQDMPAALQAMQQAARDGERSGNIHLAVSALSSAGGILMSQGKMDQAEAAYRRGVELGSAPSGRPLPISASVHSGLARLHLGRGDIQTAAELARTGVELGERWANSDSQIGSLLTLAEVALAAGQAAQAGGALEHARRLAESHLLTPGTQAYLEDFAARLQAAQAGASPQDALPQPLSDRELEVLRLLARGCSNAEIAAELILALGTVKAHTSSIYRKLDVRGRTEAVLKAGQLGLI